MKAFVLFLMATLSATTLARPQSPSLNLASVISQMSRGGGGKQPPKKKLPTQVIVAAFNHEYKADKAADILKEAAATGSLYFRNMAVIKKFYSNAVTIEESGDQSAEYATRVAMVVGSLALLILGPTGTLADGIAGALVGYAGEALVREKFQRESDAILNEDRFLEFGHILKHGTSALVVVFEDVQIRTRRMKNVNVKKKGYILLELEKKIRRALGKGKDVAFCISVDDRGICGVRMVRHNRALDIQKLIVTRRGKSVGRACAEEIEPVQSTRIGRAAYPGGFVDPKLLRETIGDVLSDDDGF